MDASRAAAAGVLWVALSGCSGEIGALGGSGDKGGPADPSDPSNSSDPSVPGVQAPEGTSTQSVAFTCDEGQRFATPPMRRLTKQQYENTLVDLLVLAVGGAEADPIRQQIQPLVDDVPNDTRKQLPQDLHGSYRRLDQDVNQAHIEAWYAVATAVGEALTTPALLGTTVGACTSDGDASNDDACVDDFIRRFGELAFRRPLSDADVAQQRTYYAPSVGIDPVGFADVIAGILSAPQFLYLIEHGGAPVDGERDTFWLDGYELASRLSYHFWGTMPDAELLDAARTGALLEQAEYQLQVDRLFHDPRTRATVRDFTRDWLKLDDLAELTKNVDAPIFRAFAGNDLPSDELRDRMIEEVLDLVDHYTWVEPAGLDAILTTDHAFPRSADLAAVYGLPVWDGQSEPPAFEAGRRPGVLTRAAFLATGTAMTRPIMRGVFIRTNILCDSIPPPPDNAAASPPELSPTLSTRQVVEALTEQDGSQCAGCHAIQINPIGFAFEGYDALGRSRAEQTLFDDDGNVATVVPVDTRTAPRIFLDDTTPSEGPADVMRLVVESGKAHACLARHYFRFSFGRWEDPVADGCVLESLRTSLTESGNIAQMLQNVTLLDAFRQRTFDG